MQELTQDILTSIETPVSGRKIAIFVYTPLCGTCKLAARMLDIVEQTIPRLMLFQVNINTMPELAEKWTITSVPGLLLFDSGQLKERHYAFHSVDFLYRLFRSFT
ncbi:thioredoxin family protein [Brevibacillus ruminantium]|uniref:Thioredoxin family protein n=1 Tax=Brevibacillus ruminantium TaxID=2950604 RepID=A0ABY4WM78_9BACL|nr:thioredoxin family protein [Brevibacillus ruminantium]USG68197.1 thioredoxin family protein [Brevibacillus ruminantium]